MKFTIVQHVTPNIDDYSKFSVASIYKYCLEHGYDYYLVRENNKRNLFAHYTKIDALKALLEFPKNNAEDEYIVFIDADMVLIEPERKLDWFVETYGTSATQIFMPQDVGKESKKEKRPFTCVIIVKKSLEGLEIIDKWIDVSLSVGKHHNEAHPYEQGVYWDYVMPELKEKQVVLPLKYFEFSPIQRLGLFRNRKPFLDHLLRRTSKVRVKMMGDLYSKYVNDQKILEQTEALLTANQLGMFQIVGKEEMASEKFETELF